MAQDQNLETTLLFICMSSASPRGSQPGSWESREAWKLVAKAEEAMAAEGAFLDAFLPIVH